MRITLILILQIFMMIMTSDRVMSSPFSMSVRGQAKVKGIVRYAFYSLLSCFVLTCSNNHFYMNVIFLSEMIIFTFKGNRVTIYWFLTKILIIKISAKTILVKIV